MRVTKAEIRTTRERLNSYVLETPTVRWPGGAIESRLAPGTEVFAKLELLQRTGSFKVRGAMNVMLSLDEKQRESGITAVSAGNHAVATAFGARQLGLDAKVVMLRHANPMRVRLVQSLGAELVFADDAAAAFQMADALVEEEGRTLVHPFEGPKTILGTATVGAELCEQAQALDAVVVPIGGGGLAAGVAAAVKEIQPETEVFGVEPVGADSMSRSLAAGRPVDLERIDTIADSLGAPGAAPVSFATCQRYLDDVVTITDEEMRAAMELIFEDIKLAVEPAGAASTAALLGPLKDRLAGRRVGLIVCGSNIDRPTYNRLLDAGAA